MGGLTTDGFTTTDVQRMDLQRIYSQRMDVQRMDKQRMKLQRMDIQLNEGSHQSRRPLLIGCSDGGKMTLPRPSGFRREEGRK